MIYTHDHAPPHVHIKTNSGSAKLLLDDLLSLEWSTMKPNDLQRARQIVREKRLYLLEKWVEQHGE